MKASGRGASEKAMILIPAGLLLVSMIVFSGGPGRFLRTLNLELGHLYGFVKTLVTTWMM